MSTRLRGLLAAVIAAVAGALAVVPAADATSSPRYREYVALGDSPLPWSTA